MKRLLLAGTLTIGTIGFITAPTAETKTERPKVILCEPDEPVKLPSEVKQPVPKKMKSATQVNAEPEVSTITMEVTGYTAGYESTQKHPGDPAYGITASGEKVEQGVTVAAGSNIPFGTQIYIPHFDGKPGFGDGVFTVQDRGGAIGPYNIDVYYEDLGEAVDFGRQILDVQIIGGGTL